MELSQTLYYYVFLSQTVVIEEKIKDYFINDPHFSMEECGFKLSKVKNFTFHSTTNAFYQMPSHLNKLHSRNTSWVILECRYG